VTANRYDRPPSNWVQGAVETVRYGEPDFRPSLRELNISPSKGRGIVGRGVDIKGDRLCITKTLEAIELLEKESPKHRDPIVAYLERIECVDELPPPYTTAYFKRSEQTAYAQWQWMSRQSIAWYAAVLAHEACHGEQYASLGPVFRERLDQRQAELECDHVTFDALVALGVMDDADRDQWICRKTARRWGEPENSCNG
jgi:hypothetical protein